MKTQLPKFLDIEIANDKIARFKSFQIANETNLSGSQLETPAHLLYLEDTPFWGGDEMEGIVVAYSGIQS